jgi:hypothetical protein
MRRPSLLALVGLSFALAVGSAPATALVIQPVSVTRTVSASSSVTDSASGMQDVDPGQTLSSTDPSLTFQIGTNSSSSLLGWSATSSSGSGTVSMLDLGSGEFGVRLALDANASVSAGTSTCLVTCAGFAGSRARLDFTFDLTAPIHVSAFASQGPFFHPAGTGMTLLNGTLVIAFGGQQGSLPFDLAPGRYTLSGTAGASAGIDQSRFLFVPTSAGSLSGVLQYNVIPEPGTALLVIAGLLGLAGWRRGRA